jgi:hypothetical protein
MNKSPGRVPASLVFAGLACILLLLTCGAAAGIPSWERPDVHPAYPGNQQTGAVGSGEGSGDITDLGSIVGSPDLFTQAQKPMTISLPALTTGSTGTGTTVTAGTGLQTGLVTKNTGTDGTTQTQTGTGVPALQTGLATKNTGSVLLTSKGAVTTSSGKIGTVVGAGTLQTSSKGGSISANLTGTTVSSGAQKACTGVNCSAKTGISVDSGIVATGGKTSKGSTVTASLCPPSKPVQTCSTNSLTGKTECTCSASTAIDTHAGQKWCEVQKCYRQEITASGKKLVQTGVAGGVWVGADEECPSCSSKMDPGSGTTTTPSYCDSFTGLEKEQCENCGADDWKSFAICKMSKPFGDSGGYKR